MKALYLSICSITLLLLTAANIQAQSTSWKGTTNTNWNNALNWTNGIPDATKDAIVGDASFTGPNSPRVNVVSTCKSVTVGGGARAISLEFVRTLNILTNCTINQNATVIHPNTTIYIAGNFINNGIYRTTNAASRVILNGGAQSISGDSVTNFRRLAIIAGSTVTLNKNIRVDDAGSLLAVYGVLDPGTFNCYVLGASRIYLNGKLLVRAANFTTNYTFVGATTIYAGAIVEYNSPANQTISSSYSYSTLILTGGGTKSLSANLIALYAKDVTNGRILVHTGTTFDLQGFTATRGTRVVGGELNLAAGAVMRLSGATNFPLNFNVRTLNSACTVEYYGAAQTISPQAYGNLLISTAGIKTATLAFSTSGNLTISNGTLNTNAVAVTHSVAGNFIVTGGTFTGTAYTYQMNGTGNQNISVSVPLSRIIVNKLSGNLTLGSDLTVTNTLTFTKGSIFTGSFSVIAVSGATVTGASQATGWVAGNLKKPVATGVSVAANFEIGDGSYSPVSLIFNNVSTAANLTAKAISSDQPEIDYSGLNPAKSVNLYWSFTDQGIIFSNATATFNWQATDMDGGADRNLFQASMFNGSVWTVQGAAPAQPSSIVVNNVNAFEEFAVGEKIGRSAWTGAALTSDWFTPKNWLGLVPQATDPTFIPNGLPAGRVYPIISSGTGNVSDLTVENNASLTIDAGRLKISGVLTSFSNVDATTGIVTFNGTALQTVLANTFTSNTVKDLVVNSNLSLDDELKITGSIAVADGKTLYTNDNLVLRSTAAGTAMLEELPVDGSGNATAFIDGNVSIERYIPARKAWRLLSAPVSNGGSTSLAATWQEGSYTESLLSNPNPNPGYGIHIAGGSQSNGFDQSSTNMPTLKVFTNSVNNFTALPATPGTFTAVNDYPGYFVYIRGDRSIDLMQGNNAAVTSTTIRMKGTVHTGNVISTVNPDNFTVLGNPYPSPIDFGAITRNNVKNSFYIWDPKLAGSNGLGAYVTVSWNSVTENYDVTSSASFISQYIPSGEAILVESEDGINPGTITITEACKTVNGSDQLFGRSNTKNSGLRINLHTSGQEQLSLLDGALITFNASHSSNVDASDVRKMFGEGGSISLLNAQKKLSIERRNTLNYKDVLSFELTQLEPGTYDLEFISNGCAIPGYEMVLLDQFDAATNNTILAEEGITRVTIRVTDNAHSKAQNRFSIAFVKNERPAFTANPVATLSPLLVYPNPVVNNTVTFKSENLEAGMYQVTIFNGNGQVLNTYLVNHTGGNVNFSESQIMLPAGFYQVELAGAGKKYRSSFIKK